MPFFCRLESRLLLRALDLDRFLIGSSAIRIWRLRRGGDMPLTCSTSAMGTACMTQSTGGSLPELQRNVNGIWRVYFETLSGYCRPPEIWIENPRWHHRLRNSGAKWRVWRLKRGLNGLIGTRIARSAP